MPASEISETELQIRAALVEAMRLLGAKSDLIGIVASWGDTMDDDWVLEALKRWNERPRS